eukprot:GFUD01033590.1.p1 GENE.GFUD01033590.1~~GFUD01033590.1.p1  ORF type:complete len:656 (+),score=179.52 GFUD01033590.1:65-2032(+)
MLSICLRHSSPHLSCTSALALTLSTSTRHSSSQGIVIPPRIERGPTDLLEALASTVGKDHTAPHYRYHDDPWLIPYKNISKRDFTLSKEAGKKAAQYILNKHPDLFDQNRIVAEPPITAFQPRAAYNRDNVTLELLDNLVTSCQVQDSMEVFNLLNEKGKDIPAEVKQSLLELVAFYNENEAEEEGMESRGMLKEQESWKVGGFVDQMYSEGGVATESERVAMLVGLGRHSGGQRVWQMYQECKANNDKVPEEGFNAAISRIGTKEGVDKIMGSVKEVLSDMKEAGVSPTVNTLISALGVLAFTAQSREYEGCCRHSLDLIAEFRLLGVEMSLGVYKVLLDIFADKKANSKSPILSDILKQLDGKDIFLAQNPQDVWFMPRAMQVCNQQNNAKLAWRVDEFLNTGHNSRLMSDFQVLNVYYQNFLTVVLQNDEFQTAMELYNKITPHSFSPMFSYYQILMNHLHANGALQHLGKVWDDIVISNYAAANKENQYVLTHQVMQILKANDPAMSDFTGLSDVWVDIARKVFNHLEEGKSNKALYLRFNTLAPDICDLVVAVALREGNYELGAKVVDFCREEKTVMTKSLSEGVLGDFINASVALGEKDKAVGAVEYSVDVGSSQAVQVGLVVAGTDMRADQRDYLNKLFTSHTGWVNI